MFLKISFVLGRGIVRFLWIYPMELRGEWVSACFLPFDCLSFIGKPPNVGRK